MAKLSESNKYLATEAMRKHAARVTVATSSAIEGIYAPFKQPKVAKKATAVVSTSTTKRGKG